MRSGFSWQVALLALAAAAVLVPADASAQCAAMRGIRGPGGGSLSAGGLATGGRGALSQGGAFVRNGSQAGSAMQMFLMMRQSQMLQQMNAMRQQQAMLSRQSATDSQRMIPHMLSRPVTNRVASASTTAIQPKPTKSRQERLREAIQKKRRETEERQAATQSGTRRRSGIIVFDGAARRSNR